MNQRARNRWLQPVVGIRIAVLLALLLVGCHSSDERAAHVAPYGRYSDGAYRPAALRRVLIMPLARRGEHVEVAEQLQAALSAKLQSTGRFDVVTLPAGSAAVSAERLWQFGRFDERELAELSRRHHVDAVIYGTVTHYRPYEPISLGVSLQMIGTFDAVVLASVEGVWDTRDAAVAQRARQYGGVSSDGSATLLGDGLVLVSPQSFLAFVSSEVAGQFTPPGPHSTAPLASAAPATQTTAHERR